MNQILITEKVIVTPEIKRKKKIYRFNFFVSIFLVFTLFSYYVYAEYDRTKSEQVSQEILLGLSQNENIVEEDTTNSIASVEDDVLVLKISEIQSEVDIPNIEQRENEPATLQEAVASDGKNYYIEATLSIPHLGIEYPVLSDTSEALLKISINKLWGPKPNEVGNYVIVGHNYKNGTMFGKLPRIQIGDTFELKDTTDRVITYRVYDKYEVEPTNVQCTSQLTGGKKEVTLITCNSNGKKRIIVKATEVI